jgi:NADH-quinone oxidoreductase subunit H
MKLGWKILIPVALAWILAIAGIRSAQRANGSPVPYLIVGAIFVILFAVWWAWDAGVQRRRSAEAEEQAADEAALRADPMAAGFPVPPLDLPHYHGVGVPPSPGGGTPRGVRGGPGQADGAEAGSGAAKEVTGA